MLHVRYPSVLFRLCNKSLWELQALKLWVALNPEIKRVLLLLATLFLLFNSNSSSRFLTFREYTNTKQYKNLEDEDVVIWKAGN